MIGLPFLPVLLWHKKFNEFIILQLNYPALIQVAVFLCPQFLRLDYIFFCDSPFSF